ncbi:efflux transporter outer membrane subunit [Paracidobacterium acidisoli]|uniref:Efflux transporter outer membrane subunit n=1 Tax=Paracidobacterium acidisoli TaxID=2303751 RepID=A0A372IMA5_9BACT|nr:efflux transporter outer membrane subunit [Paracidobacterium acidisoli]MBT9331720.1 efflux transporter outer membrane subunit [Paracidobacterium acidisoli]
MRLFRPSHAEPREIRLPVVCAAALLCLSVAGCVAGPNYHQPAAPTAPEWKEAEVPPPNPPNGAWKPAQPSDQAVRGKWWEVYGDPQLNALEEKVAVSNETLKAAMEQYLQAREQVRVARAAYYPTLSAGPSISRTRESYNQPNTVRGTTNYQYNTFALEGQASWMPDLWGRVRRTVESARASAQASAADVANVELSLQSELATDYFEMRGLDAQKQLLDNSVTAYESYLQLTQIRFKGGVATESDVALADTQLQTTKAQDIDVSVARAQFEHAVATLTGQPASMFNLGPEPLSGTPPMIPDGLPSQLLERRPDIAAAERRVDAANAQIGIAVSAYYPTVQLGGTGGFESRNAGTWLQGPSALWSLGGSAVELLFDAGQRHALTQQARDAYEQQVANYRQSVLNAFQEVEDNLSSLRILSQESQAQVLAVNAARRSLSISTNRYKGGVTTYLEVLTAQTAQLSNERTQADIMTRQYAASVQLIAALGGGWDRSQLPTL